MIVKTLKRKRREQNGGKKNEKIGTEN